MFQKKEMGLQHFDLAAESIGTPQCLAIARGDFEDKISAELLRGVDLCEWAISTFTKDKLVRLTA